MDKWQNTTKSWYFMQCCLSCFNDFLLKNKLKNMIIYVIIFLATGKSLLIRLGSIFQSEIFLAILLSNRQKLLV